MARQGNVRVKITADPSGLEKGVKRSETSLTGLGKHAENQFRSMAKAALSMGAAFTTFEGIKSAVDTTDQLAHATLKLHQNLGLTVKTGSEWAAVAKARNIDTKALQQSFGTLAKSIEASHVSTSKQAAAFKDLGVSQQTLRSGDFAKQLGAVADTLGKMEGGSKRTALGMQLFGRGWQTVLPILSQGSKGMQAQLDLADKYGASFGGDTVKSMEKFIEKQREGKLAMEGLQVTIGTKLAPILTTVIEKVTTFVKQMRDGTGAGGKFADALKSIGDFMKPIVKFFTDHPKIIAIAVGAWASYRVAAAVALAATRLKAIGVFTGLARTAETEGAASGRAFGGAFGLAMRNPVLTALAAIAAAEPWIQKLTGGDLSAPPGESTTPTGNAPSTVHPHRSGSKRNPSNPNDPTHFAPLPGDPGYKPPKKKSPKARSSSVMASIASVTHPIAAAAGSSSSGPGVALAALRAAGFRGQALVNFLAIAGRESSWNPRAENLNAATGDHSIGLWQINQLAHHGRFGTDAQLMDPYTNARAAFALYKQGGYQPWHGFTGVTQHDWAVAKATASGHGGGSGPVRRGNVTGDTSGLLILGALQALSAATGIAINVTSGRRTVAEQQVLLNQKGAYGPNNLTGAGPASGADPHVAGIAADITPGRAQLASAAGRFGLSFPLPEEPWHIQATGHKALTFGAGGGYTSAGGGGGAKPPTMGEIKQGDYDRVSGRLNTIGLEVGAGILTQAGADHQSINVINKALKGDYGPLSRDDRLSLIGTRRQARQDINQTAAAKTAQKKRLANSKKHRAYNAYVGAMNMVTTLEDAGRITSTAATALRYSAINAVLTGYYGHLDSQDKLLVLKDKKQLDDERAAEASPADTFKAAVAAGDTDPAAAGLGPNADLQAALDQANLRASIAQRSYAISQGELSTFKGAGDIGYGANVIVLRVGERDLGHAVVGALDSQGGVQATRVVTGA